MATCNGCGGVVGRDCFNPSECEWIARDMEWREAMERAESVSRDAAREAMNAGRAEISLRDAFAIAALPAIYAESVRIMEASGFPDENWREGVAMDAYAMADAMIRARAQERAHG